MKIKIILCLLLYIASVTVYGKETIKDIYFKILLGKGIAKIYVYSQPAVSFTAQKDKNSLVLNFNNPIRGNVENLYDHDKKFIKSAIIDNNGKKLTLKFQDKIEIIKWNINSGSDYYSIDINYNTQTNLETENIDSNTTTSQPQTHQDDTEELPIKQQSHIELMLDETGMKQWWQFNWDKPNTVTSFILNDYIWIIFNYEVILDIDYINKQLPNPLKLIQTHTQNYTILKLFYPNLSIDDVKLIGHDKTWNIIIGGEIPDSLTEQHRRPLAISTEQFDSKVLISGSQFDDLLRLSDPTSGNTLFIATTGLSDTYIAQQHNFVDFTILPTINNAVIYTSADYIDPKIVTQGIEIETAGWTKQSTIIK